MAERLVVEYETEDPFTDEYQEDDFEVRETAEGEVSIAAWSGGDRARAMDKADQFAEERLSLLMQQRLNEHVYAKKLTRLNDWMAGEEERIGNRVAWIDNLLEVYAHDFHEDQKTVRLPNAELRRRKNRAVREWVDEDAALRYQEEVAPEDVIHKVNKSALLKRLRPDGAFYLDVETGEIMPFVREVEPETPESFSVVQEVPDGD